jgi:hypothetical protein
LYHYAHAANFSYNKRLPRHTLDGAILTLYLTTGHWPLQLPFFYTRPWLAKTQYIVCIAINYPVWQAGKSFENQL